MTAEQGATVTALPAQSPEMSLPFDEHLLARGLSPKTVKDYLRELTWAEAWFSANGFDLVRAVPSQLVAYAETRPHTSGVRAHLRSALRYWWEWQGVRGWPDAIRVPATKPMTCKALEDPEAKAVIQAARDWWRAGTAVLVMAYLGLRNAETAGLRWDGFDEATEWYSLVGKGNRQRTLPVHPILAGELDGHRNGSPWVFEGRFGGPVSHGAIWNWVGDVAEAAGVEGRVWPHRIRHTTLAMMNDVTGDLRTVQAFAGHSRPETTAGYTRTTTRRLRAASDALDYGEDVVIEGGG